MHRSLLAAALCALPMLAVAYSFDITNHTANTIVSLEVSEDGESWGAFSDQAIKPDTTVTATWDPGTDAANCEWQVRAKYDDGTESEPGAFDVCADDLEIEFN